MNRGEHLMSASQEQPETLASDRRTVITVLGEVQADQLGHTQTHEHLVSDLSAVIETASTHPAMAAKGESALDGEMAATIRRRAHESIRLDNYDWIRRHVLNIDNLRMWDETESIEELSHFRDSGGGSIVESSPIGMGRDPQALARISRATGIHVIMGSGFYTYPYHPSVLADAAVEEIRNIIVRDVSEGVGPTSIRAGIIGEIGLSDPIHPSEAKVLRAACQAQIATGVAVQIHPGRSPQAPFEALAICQGEGADLSRVVMAHVDRTLTEKAELLELARTGCYLEYDLFGQESSYYAFSDVDRPNDATRIDQLGFLTEAGYGQKLVIAQDICQKVYLRKYGGAGYAHILENVIPIMQRKGWTAADIHQVTIENPATLLTMQVRSSTS